MATCCDTGPWFEVAIAETGEATDKKKECKHTGMAVCAAVPPNQPERLLFGLVCHMILAHVLSCHRDLVRVCPCRKVAKAYFALLEVLCHNHTGTIACQDSTTFAFILSSLDQVNRGRGGRQNGFVGAGVRGGVSLL